MYNEACQPLQAEGTFMEETARKIVAATSGLQETEERLATILNKIRGSRPSSLPPGNSEKAPEPQNCYTERMSSFHNMQNILLNSISSQLDELEKLI